MSSCISCWQSAEILRLPVLESNVRQVLKQSDFYKQSLSFMMIKPLLQYILILMGLSSGDPKFLRGELVDDDFRKATAKNDSFYVMWYKFCGMRLAYIFSDFDLADSLSDTAFDIYTYNDHCGMDQAEALLYECVSDRGLLSRSTGTPSISDSLHPKTLSIACIAGPSAKREAWSV